MLNMAKISKTDLSAIVSVALMSATLLFTAVAPLDAKTASPSEASSEMQKSSSPVARYLA